MNLDEKTKQELREITHQKGLYSVKEIQAMFGIGRYALDFAMNSGQLKWISPNSKERFVYLHDFLKYMENK